MEQVTEFKCEGENLEQIPEELITEGVSFPQVHTDKNEMARLAKGLKKHKGDVITRVPFCVTVEAEALGAKIKLGNEKTGPRVDRYFLNRVEDLSDVTHINLKTGRIKEVLDCVELLSNEGETVALSVEGPLTIASSLIDPMIFYKGLRNNPEVIGSFLNVIQDSIVEYIREGINKGARIISYGDPVGSPDIVGPKVYREVSGQASFNILKRVEGFAENTIVHLCGKTSTAFERMGLSRSESIKVREGITYGQAICDLLNEKRGVTFIGHRCIKQTPFKLKKQVLWGISLNPV